MTKLILLLCLLIADSIQMPAAVSFASGGKYTVNNSSSFPDLVNNWTVALWVKVTTPANQNWLIVSAATGSNSVKLMVYLKSSKLCFYDQVADRCSTVTISDSNWHHVALTRSGNTWTWYLDGVADTPITNSYTQSTTKYFIVIAESTNDIFWGHFGYVGSMAEVAIWSNTVLNAQEISALAKGVPPNMVEAQGLDLYAPLYAVHGLNNLPNLTKLGGTVNPNGTVVTADHCPCSPPGGAGGH